MESRTCTWGARFIDDDFEVSRSNAVTLEVSTPPRSALLSVFSSTCNPETTNRIFLLFHTLKSKLKSFHVGISVSM